MLNITHRQLTPYHPEANGAVERLYHSLKDALRACAAVATWAELPWVLLGLRAQLREETGLSLAEAVFGTPIVLPNEFLHEEEFSVDNIFKKFSKTLDAPAFSLSIKHNSSCLLPEELPADLLHTPFVWLRQGVVVPPLWCSYGVLRRGPLPFTIRVGPQDEVVSVSCLKACTDADTTPDSLRRCSRYPGSGAAAKSPATRPGGPAATKQVFFSDPLVSPPSAWALPGDGPGTVFLPPCGGVLACPGPAAPSTPPKTQYPQCQQTLPTYLVLVLCCTVPVYKLV
jgi:hypothetical protein